jgi:alkylation response protein AidB-like acyl-CoA dehydrogenase
MDLTYSEEQQQIQRQARDFFERECPLPTVRECWSSEAGLHDKLWRKMAGLGWQGALLPESYGGLGLTFTDASRLFEEMGRGLLPGPYLPTLFGAQAILLAGSAAQQQAHLPAIAKGEAKVALARCLEGGRFDRMGGRFYADAQAQGQHPGQGQGNPSGEQGFLLFGEKLSVLGLAQADWIVVPAVLGLPHPLEAGLTWFLIDARRPGVTVQPLESLEGGWKQAYLRLDGVQVGPAQRMTGGGGPHPGASVLTQVEALIDLALAFDALGGAQRVTDMTVAYARLRTAFGQPIGAYQAIKHKCADMLFAVENLRSVASWAAWTLDSAGAAGAGGAQGAVSPKLATAMARATAIESYTEVIRHGTQTHGAIGVTEEHDLPLFAKRAMTLAQAFGAVGHYHEVILRESGYATGTEDLSRMGVVKR